MSLLGQIDIKITFNLVIISIKAVLIAIIFSIFFDKRKKT